MEKEKQSCNQNLFDLTDKVAVITGGASGLGSYYTKALLSAEQTF